MTRQDAENKLREVFGLKNFYDRQWEVIQQLFQGKRILLIEKTGFGKSLCYQFPAIIFEGLTVIFSPLIALMRDQVAYLHKLGISASCINSEQDSEENTRILEEAKAGKLKILYIAPERQENLEWQEAVRHMKLSMAVVDEAHCISVWGHDFRPAYRRIVDLVNLLPQRLPVLATTATATQKVEEDIKKQITGKLVSLRGKLLRSNFHLFVIKVKSEEEKMVWIAQKVINIEGTGIIYTGTRTNTEIYYRWLDFNNISSVNYNAGMDGECRIDIEHGLMENRWKCVVSTNALGMGIDKPDIRFIIHTQIPASPVHYYQEIGRAGRDGLKTYIILFFNPEDRELPETFIDNARPSLSKYQRVIDALKEEPLGEKSIMQKTNLKQIQIRTIKADLIDQGIIREVMYGRYKKYEYQYNAPALDTKSFELLRQNRLSDLDRMIEYVNLSTCRMKFLCQYLGDDLISSCGICDNDIKKQLIVEMNKDWKKKTEDFQLNYFPELPVKSEKSNMVNGAAGSWYGVSLVGATIHKCKYENGGDFPDHLISITLRAFRKRFGQEKFDLILYVPPTESGDLVKNFAIKISNILKIPISHKLIKTRITKQQKIFQNAVSKKDNVKNAFTFDENEDLTGRKILLIDDIYDSGATIKEIGKYLTNRGAEMIAPVVIAKTVGGDVV